jgi:tetratricopeptide (TPR) repeat protein
MSLSKRVQIAALVCLLAGLGGVIYVRGFGLQLGGPPAALRTEHKTEEDWITTEIVRDITEMSAFARGVSGKRIHANAQLTQNGVYRVAVPDLLKSEFDLEPSLRVWSADRFGPFAQAALAGVRPSASPSRISVHRRLTELTSQNLATASRDISAALAANMSDPLLHDSAALAIGAFGLRESSGRFQDVRWSLNRMTAHLAMARALSGPEHRELDGRLADVVLLTLANHQAAALAALDEIDASADHDAALPWTRALRMRITQDPARLSSPGDATLVEKMEYLRSRRAVARHSRSVGDFDDLQVNPTSDIAWVRILEAHPRGVEEARFIAEGLALELEKKEAQRFAPHPNERATRCMASGTPVLIPAGAWAESSQRHFAMLIGSADAYWRHKLGNNVRAAESAAELDTELDTLTMFAPATTFRTKGKANGDADLTHLRDAISAGVHAPELFSAFVWEWLERASSYEPVREAMPLRARWFVRPSPRMPYDAGNRVKLAGHALAAADLTALGTEAPFDFALGVTSLDARFGPKAPLAEIQSTFGRRLAYDLRAIDYALERIADTEGLELREWACNINPTHCSALGAALARLNREAEAAASYERAFADPTFDRVRLANESAWLVRYYQRNRQLPKALELADASASIGSFTGVITAGHLYEDLGRFDEAEALYDQAYRRYDDPAQLLGFYYRAVIVRKEAAYNEKWRSLAPAVFADGLQDAPAKLDVPPQSGVIVIKDNPNTIKHGLQTGDIIVGLEGFRVENLDQYYAINAFFSKEQMKVTAWRGNVYTVTIHAPNRLMGVQFRSHPIVGWKEN